MIVKTRMGIKHMIKSKKEILEGFDALNETRFCVAVASYSGNTGK